jgi:hypothetical protein
MKWISRLGLLALGIVLVVTASGAAALPAGARAQGSIAPEPFPFSDRYPAQVVLGSAQDLAKLIDLGIDVDGVWPLDGGAFPAPGAAFELLVARVYVSARESSLLERQGLIAQPIPNESLRAWREYGPGQPNGWPTYDQWVARMQALATGYPNLVRLTSMGQSVQGRQLWVLKVTDNPDLEEDEPEVRYWSTHHGNEPVGAELALRLAELLTSNYGTDTGLTELVDEMEIWLCPLYNPDGYMAGTRYNAHGVDLNRDFPDRITDANDDPAGREPETQANMLFVYDHSPVMGANYHTGTLVVNYPWDSVPQPPDLAPDDALYYSYSVGYSSRNSMIYNGGFPEGVTRGWEWYIIRGGMQDWAYHWHGEHHVTIEVSNQQPPPYGQMSSYWDLNREAMLWWMERALQGVRGVVTDAATGQPLDATVDVIEVGKAVPTDPDVGDYHRLLLPGTYTVLCGAEGYVDQTWTVQVVDGPAAVQDCALVSESASTLHVGGIKLQYADKGAFYQLTGILRVLDQGNQYVAGATVAARWTLPNGRTVDQQATTGPAGLAVFRTGSRQTGLHTLCVTGVTKAGYVYDPSQNGETCDTLTIP